MKKILFMIMFCISSFMGFAQTDTHLKFKGIPITGSLNEFVTQLKNKGLVYQGSQDGIALLKGEFATFKDCNIGVATFDVTDEVCKVVAILPEKDSWNSVTGDYNTLKELLTQKYGKPEVTEIFSGERVPSNDFLKFHALLDDECNYSSKFNSEGGYIVLTMNKTDYNKASVILHYYDESNTKTVIQKALDDL